MSNLKLSQRYQPVFFKSEEFQKCTPSCYMVDMVDDVLLKLDIARHIYDDPITITSAFRSTEWEKQQGRNGSSSHTKGLAVDIYCTDSRKRIRLIRALLQAGFFRIGIAETYIHADIDTSKAAGVWLY